MDYTKLHKFLGDKYNISHLKDACPYILKKILRDFDIFVNVSQHPMITLCLKKAIDAGLSYTSVNNIAINRFKCSSIYTTISWKYVDGKYIADVTKLKGLTFKVIEYIKDKNMEYGEMLENDLSLSYMEEKEMKMKNRVAKYENTIKKLTSYIVKDLKLLAKMSGGEIEIPGSVVYEEFNDQESSYYDSITESGNVNISDPYDNILSLPLEKIDVGILMLILKLILEDHGINPKKKCG
jgi:hypothetical protein